MRTRNSDANRKAGRRFMEGHNLAKVVESFVPVDDHLQEEGPPAAKGNGAMGAPGYHGGLGNVLHGDVPRSTG